MADMIDGPHRYGGAVKWFREVPERTQVARSVSPIHLVTGRTPPVISIHGDADAVVPYEHSVLLHEELSRLQVRNRLVRIPGGRHGLDPNGHREGWRAVSAFLEELGFGRLLRE